MKSDVLTSALVALRAKLHAVAMRLLRDDEDARDAVQDTFVKLWQAQPPASDNEARNKLAHALRNVCIDRLRTRSTRPMVPLDDDVGQVVPAEDISDYERQILSGVTDAQRRIYAMVTHDCLEYDEIAQRLGMTVDAVRMTMSRARKKIRENIKALEK